MVQGSVECSPGATDLRGKIRREFVGTTTSRDLSNDLLKASHWEMEDLEGHCGSFKPKPLRKAVVIALLNSNERVCTMAGFTWKRLAK